MATTPLLMIPGPTPVAPNVLAALAEPVRNHTGPENAATMVRIQEGIRLLAGSTDARVHCFAGAGTLAMEAALVNHASPGDRVIVVSHGYFGDRFTDIADGARDARRMRCTSNGVSTPTRMHCAS